MLRGIVNLGFKLQSRRRCGQLAQENSAQIQERMLHGLVKRARNTRFGRDHRFDQIRSVADFQRAVPIRNYEALWNDYLRASYPVFEDLTWPGKIPFLALTSGTTQGTTKFIPVSSEMLASNQKAALTTLALALHSRPKSRLFHGRLCVLGGCAALEEPAPGVFQGDLSGIAATTLSPIFAPLTYPPLDIALEPDWDHKLSRLAEGSRSERITLVSGVPSWLLQFFQRLLEITGKSTLAEVWPDLEVVLHGGVKFEPYRASFRTILGSSEVLLQDVYPCSEGFIACGNPATGLLRLLVDHGLFFEFVPVDEIDSESPTRFWMKTVETGVNYAIILSTCAGLWSYMIGDTIRFESLDPPSIVFTGRTRYTLSGFGEHLINEEIEAAMADAMAATGATIRDWHAGPVFTGRLGHHQFIVEFLDEPADLDAFRRELDAGLAHRNADYQTHRAPVVGLPLPALAAARSGTFDAWMRRRGKLGGQNKVPRMDSSGVLTREIMAFLAECDGLGRMIEAGSAADSLTLH
jgi:GH3 auxin-responsive promoter